MDAVGEQKLRYHLPGHTNTVICAVELCRMGLMVTGGMDGKVIFWDLRECK
jgi:hypothetical protein